MIRLVRLGRRFGDRFVLMIFHNGRGKVTANTRFIEGGIYLESIPLQSNNYAPAVVLAHQDWGSEIYFCREREDWTDDDYFEFAERRRREMKL